MQAAGVVFVYSRLILLLTKLADQLHDHYYSLLVEALLQGWHCSGCLGKHEIAVRNNSPGYG